jgi:hypothetical protein
MAMQNKCADAATFGTPVPKGKERAEKLATSAETIAEALYRKPSKSFSLDSAFNALGGVRPRRG